MLSKKNSSFLQSTIQRIKDDGTKTCIPMVQENMDYQEYLEWAKTNTIEEPD